MSKLASRRHEDQPVGYRPVRVEWKDLDKCSVCHMDEVKANFLLHYSSLTLFFYFYKIRLSTFLLAVLVNLYFVNYKILNSFHLLGSMFLSLGADIFAFFWVGIWNSFVPTPPQASFFPSLLGFFKMILMCMWFSLAN